MLRNEKSMIICKLPIGLYKRQCFILIISCVLHIQTAPWFMWKLYNSIAHNIVPVNKTRCKTPLPITQLDFLSGPLTGILWVTFAIASNLLQGIVLILLGNDLPSIVLLYTLWTLSNHITHISRKALDTAKENEVVPPPSRKEKWENKH